MSTPACYYADINARDKRVILLLEDIGSTVSMDWQTGCSLNQAREAITELATLHASWWGRSQLDDMVWLMRRDMAAWHKDFPQRWNGLDEEDKSVLSARVIAIGEMLAKGDSEIFDSWHSTPHTLIHGDYHFQNTLFASREGSLLAVIDWSNLGVGPGTSDLSYFVTHSLTSATRKKHERDLVRLYHETLLSCGVSQYDFDACWNEYRMWALDIGMLWATIPAEGRAHIWFWDLLMSRLASAIIDLEVDDLVV